MTKKITIVGFKNVHIDDVNTFLETFRNKNAPIQFFNAQNVASSQHLYFAALNALNAFEKNRNISNNLAVETLLYASAQRQITKAVDLLGLKQVSSEIAALILTEDSDENTRYLQLISDTIHGEQDDTVLELTDKKFESIKELFQISDLELEAKLTKQGSEKEALIDLIIERMALLGTKS